MVTNGNPCSQCVLFLLEKWLPLPVYSEHNSRWCTKKINVCKPKKGFGGPNRALYFKCKLCAWWSLAISDLVYATYSIAASYDRITNCPNIHLVPLHIPKQNLPAKCTPCIFDGAFSLPPHCRSRHNRDNDKLAKPKTV